MKRKGFAFAFALILCCVLLPSPGMAIAEHCAQVHDVESRGNAEDAIMQMAACHAIDGTGEEHLCPDAPITAASYIAMLGKLRGLCDTTHVNNVSEDEYLDAALEAGWYSWDELPPTDADRLTKPLTRQVAANILVTAFFGSISYDWNLHEQISDFSKLSGRYYNGVLGGLSLDLFSHHAGAPFNPMSALTRGEACIWASNAVSKVAENAPPSATSTAPGNGETSILPVTAASPQCGGARENGWLSVRDAQLCNEHGDPIVLRGMSSMGIQWYPQYANAQSLHNIATRGANVFRIAMYTEEGGYLSNPAKISALVENIVTNAIENDLYVIIDWHILSDGNPMTHVDAAVSFFRSMSAKYADTPNVIYEICNEPNGNITWAADVKPYAERVVSAIRSNAPRSIILIGSPTWSQDVDVVASDPLRGTNLMYTLHFYAGTHGASLRTKVKRALDCGLPIFVSEWGTSAASGNGGVYIAESEMWLSFLSEHMISWCNWSLCDKRESSAALLPGTPADTVWTEENLTESGRFVFSHLTTSGSDSDRPAILPITVADVIRDHHCSSGSRTVVKNGDRILSYDDVVCTGYSVECISNVTGMDVEHGILIVRGDVLGAGTISLAQVVRMAQAYAGVRPLVGPYAEAADWDGRPGIGLSDLVAEARLFCNGGSLQLCIRQSTQHGYESSYGSG